LSRDNEIDSAIDSKTLLQVDATATVGILFFLSLSIVFVEGGPITNITLLLLPFSLSAVLILRGFWFIRPNERIPYARTLTTSGFFLLLVIMFVQALTDQYIPPTAQKCAENPEKYGINQTALWQCSK
jgi:hypothetical protein